VSGNRQLLEPVNDISLEHGRNSGHLEHLSGEQLDSHHPAFRDFQGAGLSGTQFRDLNLRYALQLARGDTDWVDPQPTQAQRDQATRDLAAWVLAARVRINGFMTGGDDDLFGPATFIYQCRTDSSNAYEANTYFPNTDAGLKLMENIEITRDGIQLRDLVLKGWCDPYQLEPLGENGQTISRNNLNLLSNPAVTDHSPFLNQWLIFKNQWAGDRGVVHTNHLHLNLGPK
jgi:hypothetical protein